MPITTDPAAPLFTSEPSFPIMSTISENSPPPSVLLISLKNESWFEGLYFHLLKSLKSRATVMESTTKSDALTKLSSSTFSAILVTTAEFASLRYEDLHSKVVEYVKAGGTVVFCGLFSSMIRPPDFDRFFRSTWSLPWKFGDYNRTTFILNPSRHARLQFNPELAASYSMKAVHVKGAKPSDTVYITTPDSVIQSFVFAPESAHKPSQAPVVFTSVGDGFVGYIGDVNAETESTAVILCMCDLKSQPECCVCGKYAAKKCGRCQKVRYCCRECQTKDWKTHKALCRGPES